jgi:glycolate oxidase
MRYEAHGLFYPPDPASLRQSAIGGNVAECAGGPRAAKYGTTRRYVLALEAVLPTGEVVRTGSKAVKNVVGYDLTQLLVGSEGTLAIITEITLRLVPKPEMRATLSASFQDVRGAVDAVLAITRARVVPATMELVDAESLAAVERRLGRVVAPPGPALCSSWRWTGCRGRSARRSSAYIWRVDTRVRQTCAARRPIPERAQCGEARRELSYGLRALAPRKINHDVVVRGDASHSSSRSSRTSVAGIGFSSLLRACGRRQYPREPDGGSSNIDEMARAAAAERELFTGWSSLEGSISGAAWHWILEGALPGPRACTRRHRADATCEGRLRPPRSS